ncbi:MAG: hypothetical protein ABIM73_04695 [Arenimonas sp.]
MAKNSDTHFIIGLRRFLITLASLQALHNATKFQKQLSGTTDAV